MMEQGAHERFALGRCLGEGSFGVVYEAEDREHDHRIALKKLRRMDPGALLGFKQEFRALADLIHPNLVQLLELFSEGDQWFFTMELVEGEDLLDYVRHDSVNPQIGTYSRSDPRTLSARPVESAAGSARSTRVHTIFRSRFDESRVRDAFAQLAEGIMALHERGMLHRDLKPSNVLVSRDGRVKLLDFGLVAHLKDAHSMGGSFAGTPAYMSPEQTAGDEVTTASDWYSAGVIMYEALTGRLPFDGTIYQIIAARETGEAPPPSDVAENIPPDLDQLVVDLLQRDPAARPTGQQIIERLVGARGEPSRSAPRETPALLVGREREIAALNAALGHARGGQAALVYIKGSSGMGKSALARSFLNDLAVDESVLVLRGKCYPRESVPYKAIDSLVDALSQQLARLPVSVVAELMPRDWFALARLFPVFTQIGKLAPPKPSAAGEIRDAQELRRRGFAALRELFAHISQHRTVVLYIDDLQWGDLDSGLLLRDLLRPPDPPPVLLIACYRSDDAANSPLLRMIEDRDQSQAERWDLEIGALTPEAARELALARLGDDSAAARQRAESLALESGGSPFFVDELARHLRAFGASAESAGLEHVIDARLDLLPDPARQLLEIIAVAARPLDARVANQAAGLDPRDTSHIELLTADQWVRRRAGDRKAVFETYHDRMRESVVARLSEQTLSSYHNRLAAALEAAGVADPETLAEHYLNAGDRELAARHALRAADQATAALAFDRAARLYRMSLELWDAVADEGSVRARLADALANASRGEEAARAYLAAATSSQPYEALELTRRAGEQFLISGAIDEGLEVFKTVLAMVGMKLDKTPRRALINLLARRLMLKVRGLGFQPRRATEVPAETLQRIDVCWSVAMGLTMVDVVQGAHFQCVNLILALRAGEPYRIARALTMEYGLSCLGGYRTEERTRMLGAMTAALVEEVDQPYTTGWFTIMKGIVANFDARFEEAVSESEKGEAILREQCTGVTWEVATAQLYQLQSLFMMGHWAETMRRWPLLLEEARKRKDRYLTTYIRTRHLFIKHLAADNPQAAHAEQASSLADWTDRGFQVQHYWDWYVSGEIDLYADDPQRARERIDSHWREYRRSFLPRTRPVEIEIRTLRARVFLALARNAANSERRALLAEAERDAELLERERTRWPVSCSTLMRAGIASLNGDQDQELELLTKVEPEFKAIPMKHFAAAVQWRRGELIGGDEGGALKKSSGDWFTSQLVTVPTRMVHMLTPWKQ